MSYSAGYFRCDSDKVVRDQLTLSFNGGKDCELSLTLQ